MSNEKILTLTVGSNLTVAELEAWEAAGWTIGFEDGCIPVEDRSGSMSSETVKKMMEELNTLFQSLDSRLTDIRHKRVEMSTRLDSMAWPTPESFKKAGDILTVPLDLSENISTTEMTSFLKEIDTLGDLGKISDYTFVITDGDK